MNRIINEWQIKQLGADTLTPVVKTIYEQPILLSTGHCMFHGWWKTNIQNIGCPHCEPHGVVAA